MKTDKSAKILIENNVYSRLIADKVIINKVYDDLAIDEVNHRTKKKYRVSFISKKDGSFKTGLITKIKYILKDLDINVSISGNEDHNSTRYEIADVPNCDMKYRDDQSFLIKKMLKKKRGVLVSLMGTGKTFIQNALIASLHDKKILCICGDKDIHEKNYKLSKQYFGDVYLLKTKYDEDWKNYRIVFASIQKMSKIDPMEFIDYFDVIIADEIHKLSESHEKILDSCNAEYRFGLTGTWPSDKKKQLSLIGLFGSVIEGEKETKLVDKGILSQIKVSLYSPEIKVCDSFRYQDIYSSCIINNEKRNELIIRNSIDRMKLGLSGLIMTTRIEHGKNLQDMAEVFGYKIPFVHGSTSMDERNRLLEELNSKRILCVITNVWREGIDIITLNYVNLAFGEKAEDRLLQIAGRTSRGHESKKWGEIVDYLDIESARYLSGHTVQRLRAYNQKGWI